MSGKIPRTHTEKFVATLTPEQKKDLAVLIAGVRSFACSGKIPVQDCLNGFMNALDRAVREV